MKAFISFCIMIVFLSCKKKPIQTTDLVSIGKIIFYDTRLSFNNTKSCASCHDPKFAFTDSYKRSIGATGDLHQRNARPLFNINDNFYFTSADSSLHSIFEQMLNPMMNTNPIELGLKGNEAILLQKLNADPKYQKMFKKYLGKISPTIDLIRSAIAAYVSSLKSYNSKYDQFLAGNKSVFNASEQNGYHLFFSEKLNCAACHGGVDFDVPTVKDDNGNLDYFHNTGIYNVSNKNIYPLQDVGLAQITKQETDNGKFRIPTLRNLIFTGPYYHDGSELNLGNVINNYTTGGRNVTEGIYRGNGESNKYKSSLIKPFILTPQEKTDLMAFLYTLTDSTILKK